MCSVFVYRSLSDVERNANAQREREKAYKLTAEIGLAMHALAPHAQMKSPAGRAIAMGAPVMLGYVQMAASKQ